MSVWNIAKQIAQRAMCAENFAWRNVQTAPPSSDPTSEAEYEYVLLGLSEGGGRGSNDKGERSSSHAYTARAGLYTCIQCRIRSDMQMRQRLFIPGDHHIYPG